MFKIIVERPRWDAGHARSAKLAGAFDEAVTTGLQRPRTTMEILTDLLRAEATHCHAASIRNRMAAAKLPVVKDLDAFRFEGTPINEGLVRSLHSGAFIETGNDSWRFKNRN
ncbi:ATP-binding protein [Sphingobium lactosutens]|uniref:ATP-binding protein n=1 Tax=Sphingobium lactosutens TaxID=522773 RepID=UPI0040387D23